MGLLVLDLSLIAKVTEMGSKKGRYTFVLEIFLTHPYHANIITYFFLMPINVEYPKNYREVILR